jgi:hypothetical protein
VTNYTLKQIPLSLSNFGEGVGDVNNDGTWEITCVISRLELVVWKVFAYLQSRRVQRMGMPRRRGLTAGKSKQTADRAQYATNAAADDMDGFRLQDTGRNTAGEDKGFDRSLAIIYLDVSG